MSDPRYLADLIRRLWEAQTGPADGVTKRLLAEAAQELEDALGRIGQAGSNPAPVVPQGDAGGTGTGDLTVPPGTLFATRNHP